MIKHLKYLDDNQRKQVLALISAARQQDGIPPIAEHIVLHLRHGGDKADSHIVIEENGAIIGYAHIDMTDMVAGSSAELVIHPARRGHALGRALLDEILTVTSPRLWAHGDLHAARKLAEGQGFERARTVIQMRRSLSAPLPTIPEDLVIRTFLPELDDEAWLDLNNETFLGHPEQGGWTLENLHQRMMEDWFDPRGFFLATLADRLVAFCWTKIHGAHSHSHDGGEVHGHDPIGEIYVMGVKPEFQGQGYGKAATHSGLAHLRSSGLTSAMLYVDADNLPAIDLYTGVGFTEWGRDVMYRKFTYGR